MSKEEFLKHLYKDGDIFHIFKYIDDLHLEGKFTETDDILESVDIKSLNITNMVGLLAITLMAKPELKKREDYYKRVEERLKEIDPERVERLLKGLK